ncbi:MAG: hypothetical protein U0166_05125 [Acidobacteriota bacterium]
MSVDVRLGGIPCRVEGFELAGPGGVHRVWDRISSPRTGMLLPPELLGLPGWLDVELRAEAEYRGQFR